jgi:diaminopimelate decarboxylase
MVHHLFESDHCDITPAGHLVFDGRNLVELADQLKTPLFLVSERILAENYLRFAHAFAGIRDFRAYYSVKTNFETEVLRTLRRLGAGAEVAGELDLYAATKAGFQPGDIVFDGPCKTERELKLAVAQGLRLVNAEGVEEIESLNALGRAAGRRLDIGVRIDPMTRRPYYDKLITTYKQKFGFHINHCAEAFAVAARCPHLRVVGINAHIGSQILAPGLYAEALDAMFGLAADLRGRGFPIEEINIGGGFPAQSMRFLRLNRRMRAAKLLERLNLLEKRTPPIGEFGRAIEQAFHRNCQLHGFTPRLTAEPGRSLVNNACILLGRVQRTKPNWVFTDLSINEVPENLFFTEWRMFFPRRMAAPAAAKANISGPTLSTYDVLSFQKSIPAGLQRGDPVVMFDVGGYSITRANQFTKPRNPVYFLGQDGTIRLIRRRETIEDVVHTQMWDPPSPVDEAAAVGIPVESISG